MRDGSGLALTSVLGLALLSVMKPSGSPVRLHGQTSTRELRKMARDELDSGFCGDADDPYLYHIAPVEQIESISREGLQPDRVEPGFVGFQSWSRGKIFLAGGDDAASQWVDILQSSQKRRWRSAFWVKLRVSLDSLAYKMIRLDTASELPCSFFVTRPIKPEHLEVHLDEAWVTLTPAVAGHIIRTVPTA